MFVISSFVHMKWECRLHIVFTMMPVVPFPKSNMKDLRMIAFKKRFDGATMR